MLLKLKKYAKINIEVALCIKSPYACKGTNTFIADTAVGSYSEFYGTILSKEATCDGISYRTYFKLKNNEVSYYSHFGAEKFITVNMNLLRISYFGL